MTPEAINFMARFGRGLICLALDGPTCDRLKLHPQSEKNTTSFGTAFTVSVDAAKGMRPGSPLADRARTIQVAVDPASVPEDLARPGHIFPLRARDGGVLVRTGQTEGSVDLARLAELKPAGVICEIMNEDGTMSRVPELTRFCREHGLKMGSVADLIRYRRRHEQHVHHSVTVKLPTDSGEWDLHVYLADYDERPHLALCKGGIGKRGDRTATVAQRQASRCSCASTRSA